MEDRPIFDKASAAGMTVKQYRAYEGLIEKQRVEDAKAQRDWALKREAERQTDEWKDNAKKIKDQVREELRNRPDIAADDFLREGTYDGEKVKGVRPTLDSAKLTPEQKATLPEKYYSAHGSNPDDVAGLFGYQTGGQLIDRLVETQRLRKELDLGPKELFNRYVADEVERRMQKEFGKLDENILKEAQEYVVSQTQLDLLHQDLIRLGTENNAELSFTKEQIKSWAKDTFNKYSVSIKMEDLLRHAVKVGNNAERALLEGDPIEAFKLKQQQLLSMHLANEAKKFGKQIAAFERQAKQFQKRQLPGVDQDYTNQVHDLLSRVGKPVRRSVQDLQKALEGEGLDAFSQRKNQIGWRMVDVPEFLKDGTFRKSFEDLTVGEAKDVANMVKSLAYQGRAERKLDLHGREYEFDSVLGHMIDQFRTFIAKNYDTEGGRWLMGFVPPKSASKVRTYLVNHLQLESLFNRIDRGDSRGVFTQFIMRDLTESANSVSALERKYAKRIQALEDKVDIDEKIPNNLFINPSSKKFGDAQYYEPFEMTRKHLRAILSYWGSPARREKLLKGYELEEEPVKAWIEKNATAKDWAFAENLGKIFADIKREADRMYTRVSGLPVIEDDLVPFTMNVEGKPKSFNGWYHPISYHPLWEQGSPKLMGGDALQQEQFYRAVAPLAGYTKQLTGAYGPLDLSLDMYTIRMKQMLHVPDVAGRNPG